MAENNTRAARNTGDGAEVNKVRIANDSAPVSRYPIACAEAFGHALA